MKIQIPRNIWGLGIGDWGFGIGQSPIPNPQYNRYKFFLNLIKNSKSNLN